MELIAEKAVNEIWQEVSGFTPDRALKEMTQLGRRQPELLSFIMEFTKYLDQEVTELAVYMFFTIFRMFQKNLSDRIRTISSAEIIECYESNDNLLESLEGAHDKFIERIARIQISEQPYVMRYVIDTLMEVSEDEDFLDLTVEDKSLLFLLLKTVIDILNRVTDEQ